MSDQEIVIKISAKNLTAEEFSKARAELSGLTEHAKSEGDKVGANTIAMGTLIAHGYEIGLEGARKLVEFFPHMIEQAVGLGNKLYDMSLKSGASVEGLSALRYVASQTGIEFDAFGTTLFKMEKALGASGEEAVKTQGHLDRLHLNLNTLKNEKPDQAFIDIVSALEKIPNAADRASIGASIFGKGWKEMAGLANEDIEKLVKEAEDLGLVMSTKTAAAAHVAEISMKSFGMQVEAVENRVAAAFIPGLATITRMLSTEFTKAMNDAGVSTDNTQGIIVSIAQTMLSWADTGISVAQFLYLSFNNVKQDIYGVLGAVVSLADGFIGLLLNAAQIAEKIPGIGSQFKGVTGTIQETKDWVGSLAHGFTSLSHEAQAANDASGRVFDGLHSTLQRTAAGFATELAKTEKEIDDFAEKSKKAGGEAGEVADTVKDKTKEYNKAWQELNSTGATYLETINTIDPKILEQIEYYLKAGHSVGTLAKAYPVLTEAQVQAVDTLVKKNEEYTKSWERTEKETEKIWGQAFIAQADLGSRGLEKHLEDLRTKHDLDVNAANVSIDDETLRQARLYALDAEYLAKKERLERDAATKKADALKSIAAELASTEASLAGDVLKAKLDANQKALADALIKIDKQFDGDKDLKDREVELYKRKAQLIIAENDPVFKAWEGLNRDMRQEWANTWETALSGDKGIQGFVDALVAPFKEIETSFLKLLAGMIADWETELLAPMMSSFKSSMGSLFNQKQSGSSSSSGSGGFLSKLFSGGGGNSDTVNGGTGSFGDDGGWTSNGDGDGGGSGGSGGMLSGLASAGIGFGISMLPQIIGWIKGIGGPSKDELAARSTFGDFEKQLGTSTLPETLAKISDAYVKMGKTGSDAARDLQIALDNTHKSAAAEAAALKTINDILGDQEQDATDLDSAIQKYKFSIAELGPTMKAQELSKQAAGLENDFRLLAGSGIGVDTVLKHMGGSINDFLHLAQQTGSEVPSEMQPILQKMIDMGTLTDSNGKKITNIKDIGVTFSESMTKGFQKIVDRLDTLLDKLGLVPKALDDIPSSKTISIDYVTTGDPTGGMETSATTTTKGAPTPKAADYAALLDQWYALDSSYRLSTTFDDWKATQVPAFASEAFVRKPTLAIVGDTPEGELVLKPSTVASWMGRAATSARAEAVRGFDTSGMESQLADLHETVKGQQTTLLRLMAQQPLLIRDALNNTGAMR